MVTVQCESSRIREWCEGVQRSYCVIFLENDLVVLLDIALHFFNIKNK